MEEHVQDHMYEAGMITSIALFTVLGFLLNAVGVATWTAEWWCVLGLFLAHGWHQHSQGVDHAEEEIKKLIQHARATLAEAEAIKTQAEQHMNKKDPQ